jgi:hypothetical protein
MKTFKAQQIYFLFILILSAFFITGCGGGEVTGHWLPSSNAIPTVSSTDPINIATDVCIDKEITATFSKAMLASTIVAPGTFTVMDTTAAAGVFGIVTYDEPTKIATFTPTADLIPTHHYTATITTAATDLAGNPLADDKEWSFIVGVGTCAPTPPPTGCTTGDLSLGSAASFAVLGGSALTITNPTSITGDIGSPTITPAVGPDTLIGTMYDSSPASELVVIATAVKDMKTAVGCAAARSCDYNYSGATDFATKGVLAAGVHCVDGAMSVGSTPFTLSNPGVYIFRATGALTTANTITMTLSGGANPGNTSVYWVSSGPASAVSIGATSAFLGTIMCSPCAAGAVMGANTTLLGGRVLSGAAVTLDKNHITIP